MADFGSKTGKEGTGGRDDLSATRPFMADVQISKGEAVGEDDKAGASTMPPPGATTERPPAGQGHFVQLFDQASGEAVRMIVCLNVLSKAAKTLSDRDFDAKKAFERSVFLMPFPQVLFNGQVRMEVFGFDHNDTVDTLVDINNNLIKLIGFRDASTVRTLTRDGRLNLIKALTIYYADLTGQEVEDLKVDFVAAIGSIRKMDWVLSTEPETNVFKLGFNLGKRDEVIIDDTKLQVFKLRLIEFFTMRAGNSPVAFARTAARGASREIPAALAIVPPRRSEVLTRQPEPDDLTSAFNRAAKKAAETLTDSTELEGARREALEAIRIANLLKSISQDMITILEPGGGCRESTVVLTLIGEMMSTERLNHSRYKALFSLGNSAAMKLVNRMAGARVDIVQLGLPKDLIFAIMLHFWNRSEWLGTELMGRIAACLK